MDIATVVIQEGLYFDLDWLLCGPDMESDAGLVTAITLSLMSDRLASADDELPDGSADRRGWWGDSFADVPGDLIGSRLWLLKRAVASPQTAARAVAYVLEALQWLVDDGVAATVGCTSQWISRDQLGLAIAVAQRGANGTVATHVYDFVWTFTLGGGPLPCALASPSGTPVLLSEDGATPLLTESGQPLLSQ
ncbi:MAG TPA: phage GP46 family protein [Acetobacteraceae bacterium]